MGDDLFFMSENSKNDLEIIKKDNRLIETKYRLPINAQRLLFAVLKSIRADDEEFKNYTINLKEVAERHGLKTNKDLYDQFRQAARTLKDSEVEISIGKRKRFVNWLNYVEYEEGKGEVVVCFNKQLMPYLLDLKANFTKYQYAAVANFKNYYSIRFYEFLKMRQNQGNGGQFYIQYSIEKLRDILRIEPNEYSLTKDLRVRIIEPALKEIDTQTDLAIVDVQYIKRGRAIAEIKIIAEPKKQRALPIPKQPEPAEKDPHPIIESLVSLGFSEENAKSFKIKHGIKKIERNIAYTLAKKQDGEVKNIPAYLSRAIEQDWGSAWESEQAKEKNKREKIRLDEAQKKKEQEQRKDEEKQAKDLIIKDFLLLPKAKINTVIKACIDGIKVPSTKTRCLNAFKEFGEDELKKDRSILRLHLLVYLKELETTGNE